MLRFTVDKLAKHFEVHFEIETIHETWVYGKFFFQIGENIIGNEEESVALNIAFGWIEQYLKTNQFENDSRITELSTEEVFATFYDPFFIYKVTSLQPKFPIISHPNDYRFYVSHLGESSFNNWAILFFDNTGFQRILWATLDSRSISEAFLEVNTFQNALQNALKKYHEALLRVRPP